MSARPSFPVTRFAFDTEFLEYSEHGAHHLHLISIGIVSEKGDEFYAENVGFDWALAERHNPWLLDKVRPHLDGGDARMILPKIASGILNLTHHVNPEFWAYVADYDWVMFCSIFGKMVDLPHFMPHFCMDLKQVTAVRQIPKSALPKQVGASHNALEDARWNAAALRHIGVWH